MAGKSSVDLHDPLFRRYTLAREFHLSPAEQDRCAAVDLDELLVVHSHVQELRADQRGKG